MKTKYEEIMFANISSHFGGDIAANTIEKAKGEGFDLATKKLAKKIRKGGVNLYRPEAISRISKELDAEIKKGAKETISEKEYDFLLRKSDFVNSLNKVLIPVNNGGNKSFHKFLFVEK